MKHLKKLSVVLMMTILFSVSFTSCIDNEVSPVVEAIYEAQANLLAAQAGVQNAEAALLLAQAQSEQARVAYTNAQTAQLAAVTAGITANNAYEATRRQQLLLQLVADTNLSVATAQNSLALAQVAFQTQLAAATAIMRAAGAAVAAGYAEKYALAMADANTLKSLKLTAEGELANLELYLRAGTPPTWALYLAGLNADLAVQTGKITAAEAAIVALNTAKANPTARETQIAGLQSQVKVLNARQTELIALKALALQEVTNANAAITAATAFMADPAGPYAMAKASLTFWKNAYTVDSTAVKANTLLVTQHTAAISNYAATTASLTLTKDAAVAAVGQSATLPYTGLKGDIQTLVNTLGVYGNAPVYGNTPRTVITAYNKLWNADLALLKFNQDFAGLTASYNAAAIALVTATNNYNFANWPAANTAASAALLVAQSNVTIATGDYNAKKTIFEADPTGVTWFAGADGLLGNHADGALMSKIYVVTNNLTTANTTGTSTVAVGTSPISGAAITLANVYDVAFNNIGVAGDYYNFETDDVSQTNVSLFNTASANLGVKITTAYYTGTTIRTYASDIAPADTAYKALWNAEKLVSQNLYLQANAAAILAVAQDDYNYQKGLFEAGLATRATLEATVAAELAVIGNVSVVGPPAIAASGLLGQLEAKNNQLGNTAFAIAISTDVAKTTAGTLGSDYYMVGTVKTLTAYAVKWNAELALAKHLATSLAAHQTMLAAAQLALTTATREAAEDLIFVAKYTADLAALQAQYNALILTPLYAALNVTLVNKQQAYATLVAEDSANVSMIVSLNLVIAGLQVTVPDYTALIAAQNLIITNAKAALLATQIAISQGNVTLADLQRAVQVKKDLIATLTQQIANALALAAKYKALMDAALAA